MLIMALDNIEGLTYLVMQPGYSHSLVIVHPSKPGHTHHTVYYCRFDWLRFANVHHFFLTFPIEEVLPLAYLVTCLLGMILNTK